CEVLLSSIDIIYELQECLSPHIRNRKDSLMTYLEDGRCSLSNNLSENTIRPITIERKNWHSVILQMEHTPAWSASQ
ncbi:transposase, partial [Anaerostipes hadrus]